MERDPDGGFSWHYFFSRIDNPKTARMVGRIAGQQAARGVVIAFEDLLIGVTALQLGCDVGTLNVRHFRLIRGLSVVQF